MTNPRVLVVDDNPSNVKLATYLLSADGFDVCAAETLDEIIAALASSRPELILMDLRLRGVDGLTLVRHLRSDPANERIPIVACSAEVTRGDERRLLDAGCDGHIQKPIDVEKFCSMVRQYLDSNSVRERDEDRVDAFQGRQFVRQTGFTLSNLRNRSRIGDSTRSCTNPSAPKVLRTSSSAASLPITHYESMTWEDKASLGLTSY